MADSGRAPTTDRRTTKSSGDNSQLEDYFRGNPGIPQILTDRQKDVLDTYDQDMRDFQARLRNNAIHRQEWDRQIQELHRQSQDQEREDETIRRRMTELQSVYQTAKDIEAQASVIFQNLLRKKNAGALLTVHS